MPTGSPCASNLTTESKRECKQVPRNHLTGHNVTWRPMKADIYRRLQPRAV